MKLYIVPVVLLADYRAGFIDFDDAKAYANTLLEGKICPDGT